MRFYWMLYLMLILSSCAKNDHSAGGKFERPLPVSIAEVSQRDVLIYIESIGHIVADHSVNIKPQVAGTIADVFIEGGDHVQVGELLYRIDPLPYVVALERAQATLLKNQAELEYSQKKLERYEGLLKADFVSKLSIEEYKSDVKVKEGQVLIDKAEVQATQINLQYCDVAAPIDGKVSLSKVDRGNIVTQNDSNALITILQINPISVEFSLSQKDFQDVQGILRKQDSKFTILLPYGDKREFEGRLEAFDNRINLQTGTIQLKGRIPNPEEILWPGQFVRVRLLMGKKENASIVPFSAIQLGQSGEYVYVLKPDMTVEYVPVKTSIRLGEDIVVDEGLEPGLQVVTDGQLNLQSGAKVIIPSQMQPPSEANLS